jgi:hypothetical protein
METKKKIIKQSELWIILWHIDDDCWCYGWSAHKCKSFTEAKNYVSGLIYEDNIDPKDIEVYSGDKQCIKKYIVALDLVNM